MDRSNFPENDLFSMSQSKIHLKMNGFRLLNTTTATQTLNPSNYFFDLVIQRMQKKNASAI